MRSHMIALLCWLSVLLAVEAGRGRGRGYHRTSGRTDHAGGYGGYGRGHGRGVGHGYGGYVSGYRRGNGGYGHGYSGGYGGRHNAGRNAGGRDGYGVPHPPPDECTPPCYRTYGVPGQEKCVCRDTSTMTTTSASVGTASTAATTATITTTPSTTAATSTIHTSTATTSPTISLITSTTTSPSTTYTPIASLTTSSYTSTTSSPTTYSGDSSTTSLTTFLTTSSTFSPTTSSVTSLTTFPTSSSTTSSATSTTTASTTTISSTTTSSCPTTIPRPCEQSPSCRPGFTPFRQRCWKMTENDGKNLTNAQAREKCCADNSTLASIRDEDDNNFVTNLAKNGTFMRYNDFQKTWYPSMAQNYVHIGAFKTPGPESQWSWIDGTSFTYSNWITDFPDIYPSNGTEPYAAILPDFYFKSGTWNDIDGSTEARAGICAYDLCPGQAQASA